jgi:hypothetical protein
MVDQNQGQRRGHFHRGRRGSDRRGIDRRSQQPPPQERGGGNQVDVEQIMREIRGRIAQRQGIDLSNQQIQDLAARRLESILDPRAIKPSLLDALRRSAGAQAQRAAGKIPNEPAFSFEDTTIYDSHRGLMRFIRRMLNPLLKLFFNPNPLIRALHIQAKLNVEAAERDAERDRRQTEWNALHYEIVQRLVTEVSRATLELQAQSLRVESLDAKVEFNERRVRGIEGSVHRARPQVVPGRPEPSAVSAPAPEAEPASAEAPVAAPAESGQTSESARRRRRRRRGRRSGMGPGEGPPSPSGPRGPGGFGEMAAPPRPDVVSMGERRPEESRASVEHVPDTGITEAPPVPFERTSAPAPFEHPVPTPFDHAPVEHALIEPPPPIEPPSVELPPMELPPIEHPPMAAAVPEPPPPAPAPPAAAEVPPSAPDPDRHEY